jgi:hypothetical protein
MQSQNRILRNSQYVDLEVILCYLSCQRWIIAKGGSSLIKKLAVLLTLLLVLISVLSLAACSKETTTVPTTVPPTVTPTSMGATGWSRQNILPTDYSLHSIWGSSYSDVFAVGDSGTILHYNGSSWSGMNIGNTNWLFGVWGSSVSDVFAVGLRDDTMEGVILHYNGSTWSAMSTGTTTDYLFGVWGSSPSNVFAVGGRGTVLHY